MKTQLFLWDKAAEFYKEELAFVKKYYDRTIVQFNDIEKEAEDFAESFFQNYIGDENTDPSEVAEIAEGKSVELYQMLSLMKSNHLLITISMLYGIWEQQIMNFIIGELKKDISKSINKINFNQLKDIFIAHGINFEKLNSWPVIWELKLLNNTIKHGIGDSSDKLKRIRPDYFEVEYLPGVDTLHLHGTVLTEESLQVKEDDLNKYVKATKEFWNEIPERSFADIKDILTILNN
jgi:hypothetical protein